MKNRLSQSSYQQAIVSNFKALCRLLGHNASRMSTWNSLIDTYMPYVLEDIFALAIEPEEFCKCLEFVDSRTFDIPADLSIKDFDYEICNGTDFEVEPHCSQLDGEDTRFLNRADPHAEPEMWPSHFGAPEMILCQQNVWFGFDVASCSLLMATSSKYPL
ncbi:unnamed protein product [Soboliphyme baturini]|uniref:Cytochrome P450 n=1 Tax=Soboliphyme baturini TaxID=241478 RepID=A0A183J537_9BILA|nr:unnamed protein product [Soboliphyme baturini]